MIDATNLVKWLKQAFCWHDYEQTMALVPWMKRNRCKKCEYTWYDYTSRFG